MEACGDEARWRMLCVGCLEKRIGRRLKPNDFDDHVFNTWPGLTGS